MAKRFDVLELAVLGMLEHEDMHGYAMRKRLAAMLGPLRPISFGSLYPCLKLLTDQGYIQPLMTAGTGALGAGSKRTRVEYRITDAGRSYFRSLMSHSHEETWEDNQFRVRLAFFHLSDPETRLRILHGRRARVLKDLDVLTANATSNDQSGTDYADSFASHEIETARRTLSWLDVMIERERAT